MEYGLMCDGIILCERHDLTFLHRHACASKVTIVLESITLLG